MKRCKIRVTMAAVIALLLATAAAAMPQTLVAVGRTVGIRLETDGILVAELEPGGPAEQAGLRSGDVIETVNGTEITSCEQFQSMLQSCDGSPLDLAIERNGKDAAVTVAPTRGAADVDLAQGPCVIIGRCSDVIVEDSDYTIKGANINLNTDSDGHGVNDLQSLVLLPVESGEILPSSVVEVRKGVRGTPGLLKGAFDTSTTLGTVERNTDHGIFGQCSGQLGGMPLPVATAEEIQTGKATILSNVQNTNVVAYAVEITRLDPTDRSGRNLVLTITDDRLLQTTGGIVQGMSGSPIVQNGKLIGAVTHVLIDDPSRGYGIFIENMLAAGDNLQ